MASAIQRLTVPDCADRVAAMARIAARVGP